MSMTFDREILDMRKSYRGHNYENAKEWFNEIEPFKFTFTYPSLDWYETANVEIRWNDFDSFSLERRYGPTWWLVGHVLYDKLTDRNFRERWETEQIGEFMNERDVARFIIWTRKLSKYNGSALSKITAIDNDMDLFKEIILIQKEIEKLEVKE